jgi:lactate dehydrogenase-like 2-hydroxyacid dehydrogenase
MVDTMLPSLEKSFRVFKLYEAGGSREEQSSFVAAHARSIRAVVGNTEVGASAELIRSLPALEIVSTFSVGLDKIDLPLCAQRGIAVTYTPDVLTECTADTALALMLACMRRVPAADRFVRQGRWPREGPFVLTTRV